LGLSVAGDWEIGKLCPAPCNKKAAGKRLCTCDWESY